MSDAFTPMPDDRLELLTTAQLAQLWHCDPSTISRKAATGEIPCVRIGRLVRFSREALENFIGIYINDTPGM